MKKSIITSMIFLMIFVINVACNEEEKDASVRFENSNDVYDILYGIRMGDAEHLGSLNRGDTTEYYSTDPGSYYIDVLTDNDEWEHATDEKIKLKEDKKYTVTFQGGQYFSSFFITSKSQNMDEDSQAGESSVDFRYNDNIYKVIEEDSF